METRDELEQWIKNLPLQTLTDELKEDLMDKFDTTMYNIAKKF